MSTTATDLRDVTGGEGQELVAAFLDWMRLERGRSPRTVDAYEGDLRRFSAWLAERGGRLDDADSTAVATYLAEMRERGRSERTVARAHVALSGLYRHALVEGHLGVDPTALIEAPSRRESLPKPLSEAQVTMLLDSVVGMRPVDLRDRAMLEVLYGTGIRISEMCGLNDGDIDLDGRLMRVLGKGDKERVVPLGRAATAALASWLDDGGRPDLVAPSDRRDDIRAIFRSARGRRMTRQGAWFVIDRRARAVGLGEIVSPHVMRHSCATHMLAHGADIRAVQELLGHASISTTQAYTKVAVDRLWAEYDRCHPRAGRLRATPREP